MSKLKKSFAKTRTIAPLHTGGPVAVTSNETHLVTCVGDEVVLTQLKDGRVISRFPCDNETVHSLCLSPSSSHLIVFTASMTMFIFDNPTTESTSERVVKPSRTIPRAHDAPVHVCKFEPTSTLLASGSADGIVKVWDVRRGYATHAFRGHGGVVSALAFRYVNDLSSVVASEPTLHLITGSIDSRLRVFDLSPSASRTGSSKAIAVLEGHMSVPRGLDVSEDGKWLISGGRDAVVLVWDLLPLDHASTSSKSGKPGKSVAQIPTLSRTITVLERVEAVGFIHDNLSFFTAGEKGTVKLWDAKTGNCVFAFDTYETDSGEQVDEQHEIVNACFVIPTRTVMSVHADQNILFHSTMSRSLTRQLIGYNDEIIDTQFLSSNDADSHIAVATNSSLIRVYSVADYDARLLAGHTNVILCLDRSRSGRLLASGSKDKTARIWDYSEEGKGWTCVGVCEGHAESVGSVALSKKSTDGEHNRPQFMVTGSQDCTIKLWDLSCLPITPPDSPLKFRSLSTMKAHDKDINALDISPNDQFLASASQDRTVKVYEIQHSVNASSARGELKLLGTCKGHKRGVWTVRFGSMERILATGSGDKTIKLWNLDDFSCVKTLEGHTNSVLQIRLISGDAQLVSSSSDGLLKLWNVRTDECVATMDNHTDKVWALGVGSDESTVISGGADSVITFWRDCTTEIEQEKEEKRVEMVQREQDLMNYLSLKDYSRAISLALALDQPGRLFSIFSSVISTSHDDASAQRQKTFTGSVDVDTVIRNLSQPELAILIRRLRDWNSNVKTSTVAQTVLYAVMRLRSTDDVMGAITSAVTVPGEGPGKVKANSDEIVPSLIPYTERHLTRIDRLIQESYVLDVILGEMDDGLEVVEL